MVDRQTYWVLGGLSTVLALWLWGTLHLTTGAPITVVDVVARAGGAGPTALSGEYYRLFTATLAHLSVGHLVGNLVLLWIAGISLGRLAPTGLILFTFLLAGWLGTVATLLVSGGWALGASAGVFGIFGALIGQLRHRGGPIGLVQGVILGALILAVASFGYGDILAHWSGFATGVWIGAFVWSRSGAWFAASLVGLVACVAAMFHWVCG